MPPPAHSVSSHYRRDTPPPRDAVVFDCDGVLVNTQDSWNRAYAELFTRYGARLDRAQRHALIGLQLIPLGHALARMLGHPAPPDTLGRELYELVETNLDTAITPMPGVVALLNALTGTRPLAVASNTPSPIVRSYLASVGIVDAFDHIIGSDNVPQPKPAPDTYLTACARLGIDPRRAIAIEDSPTGVTAALAAGMYVVGVPSSPDLNLPAHHTATTLHDPQLWMTLGLAPQHLSLGRRVRNTNGVSGVFG